nr:MAG TPA: RecT protein [Caudoviricetes sp.]
METQNNTPAKKAQTPLQAFNSFMMNPNTQDYLKSVLKEKSASFMNNMVALVANNRALQPCKPASIMYVGLKATALGLPLDQNLGFAYAIPYKDNKAGETVAQFQMGYKGFIQLALRTGQFSTINATDIREGEISSINRLTGEITFTDVPDRAGRKIVGYAAFFRLTNGFRKTLYMSVEEITEHAKRYSQTFKSEYTRKSSKWTTDFDAMATKTVLKLLLSKYAPLSVEMQELREAITADQASFGDNGEIDYIDGVGVEEISAEAVQEVVHEQKDEMKEKDTKTVVEGMLM